LPLLVAIWGSSPWRLPRALAAGPCARSRRGKGCRPLARARRSGSTARRSQGKGEPGRRATRWGASGPGTGLGRLDWRARAEKTLKPIRRSLLLWSLHKERPRPSPLRESAVPAPPGRRGWRGSLEATRSGQPGVRLRSTASAGAASWGRGRRPRCRGQTIPRSTAHPVWDRSASSWPASQALRARVGCFRVWTSFPPLPLHAIKWRKRDPSAASLLTK
jgi:hypothetical protein